ncbi:hypothetical protein A3SI_20147 [Nitritalea halalkaliphila LW7]|uniref:OmpA/MotB domain-containing protein n=1 Tax=Nitritalea halalkaliphila LW7 TaxID=1189621 RepID=I5BQY9_9BACT|nr:hypothetical protein [Nitritalea halalkaliphila]EIM71991.1 hypothetical protein A3SI_20147 [Nitritalea halalkaliphila LW7]
MKKFIAISSLVVFGLLSWPFTGQAQEKLESDGGKGPKEVFCVKSPKVKFGYSWHSGASVGVEVGFGWKTACKAAAQETCTKTNCE